jgi:hypothetical protein
MKKYLIVLAILLTGSPSASQIKIAERYSPFFGNEVRVGVVNVIDDGKVKNCGVPLKKDSRVIGCTNFYPGGVKTLQVISNLDEKQFEFAMLHEVGHYYFGISEKRSTDFANSMLYFYQTLINFR